MRDHGGDLDRAMSRYGSEGWQVSEIATPQEVTGADLAIVVNPNNPDGRCWTADDLLNLGVVPDISLFAWMVAAGPARKRGWLGPAQRGAGCA